MYSGGGGGGNSSSSSGVGGGGSVVSAAREAREERAAARRRGAAAVVVQAALRGFITRCRYGRKIREVFDGVFPEVQTIPATSVSDPTTTATAAPATTTALPAAIAAFTAAAPLIRRYTDGDSERLHRYTRYLVTSLNCNALQQRCIACALSQQHTVAWIQHIKQMLVLSCGVLSSLSGEVVSENRLLSLHLHLILGLTSTLSWPPLPPPLLPPLSKLTATFLQHLVATGLYPTLKRVLLKGLCRSKPMLRGPALCTVLTLALRPLPSQLPSALPAVIPAKATIATAAQSTSKASKSGKNKPGAGNSSKSSARSDGVYVHEQLLISQFILQFMSVPAVMHHLTTMLPESINLLHKKRIFEQCVEFLSDEQQLRIVFHTLEGSYALCLLANIIHLGHNFVSTVNATIKKNKDTSSGGGGGSSAAETSVTLVNTSPRLSGNANASTSSSERQTNPTQTNITQNEVTKEQLDVLMFKFNIIVRRLLEKSGEYVSNKQGSSAVGGTVKNINTSSQWHPVLGWFSQQLDQFLQESLLYVRGQLYLLWSQPLLNTLFAILPTLLPRHETNSQLAMRQSYQTDAITVAQSTQSSRPWSLRRIFERKLSMGSSAGRNSSGSVGVINKLNSVPVQRVAATCSLYYLAMHTLSQLKMDILTGLCYKSNVVAQLWWLLQSLGNNCGLRNFLERLAQVTKPSTPECHMVILFCDTTAHLVTVLDDLELYEHQKPFTTADYTSIAVFLNSMCYQLIASGLVDSRHVWSCPLFSAAHSLLSLLFRRNSRRAFVPSESTWIIPELRLSAFKDNLMNGNIVEQVLLQTLPHIIPHEERVLLFRANVSAQKATLALAAPHPYTLITVFRSRLVEDGYRQLNSLSPNGLKGVIRVRFVNEQGLDEAGIDQDGVFKEFLEETLKRVLDPSLNLFCMSSENQLYPSPSSSLTENHLELLEFTGKMLGKALYEGIVVDCPFAGFFLSHVIGEQQSALYSSIDQLNSLDPELYKNLTYIKHYDGNFDDLGLTFSYDEERLGEVVSHDLRPGGKLLPVTIDNRIIYIHLMAHFKMHTQIRDQTKAFVRGFRSIINPEWLAMFSIPELQRIISGDNIAINFKELRKHTQYYGGFHDSHRVVCWLWDIMEKDFTSKEHSLFLKFVTSCSKPPLLGFSYLEPPFSIRCVEVCDDEDTGDTVGSVVRGFLAVGRRDPVHRLPTASTCFNLLKLPNYQKKQTLRNKLRYAITSNTGFELS